MAPAGGALANAIFDATESGFVSYAYVRDPEGGDGREAYRIVVRQVWDRLGLNLQKLADCWRL